MISFSHICTNCGQYFEYHNKKQLENSQVYGPQLPSKGMAGSKLNPYIGMSFSKAYGTANKATGGQGTFWWESEKGGSKEYGFQ